MKHIITRDEIEAVIITHQLAASKGNGEHKTLIVEMDIEGMYREFVVTSHGKEQRFISLDDAIQAYNEAQ
jgi:hypothetical protein